MKSPSQLKSEFDLTSMRLRCLEDEIAQKIKEGQKLSRKKSELRQLIKEAEQIQ